MRREGVLLVAALLFFGTAASARAAPVSGGRYVGTTRLPNGDHASVEFWLANDGREFAARSSVWVDLRCHRPQDVAYATSTLDASEYPFRAVRIGAGGRFSLKAKHREEPGIRGRFVHRGRDVVGTITLLGKGPCGGVTGPYAARLTSRPNRTPAGRHALCDRVTLRYPDDLGTDEAYSVDEKGIGCTRARSLALQWDASGRCRRLAAGSACTVGGSVCTAVHGGRIRRVASARCATDAGGWVEMVHYLPCKAPASARARYVNTWTINVPCLAATQFPVDDLVPDEQTNRGPCGDIFDLNHPVRCRPVAGYVCTLRTAYFGPDRGFRALCADENEPFQALLFDYSF